MSIEDKLLGAPAGGLTPSDNFNTVIYDGNGGANAITGVGFQPDWVWIKQRDVAVEQHNVYDSTRGIRYFLVSNSSAAQVYGSANRLNAFDSDGFTIGSDNEINDSGSTYVAWCWKANGGTTASNTEGSITSTVQANDDAGFSMVKFTGTGANATVGHGLSSAPEMIIFKAYTTIASWKCYNHQLTSPTTQVVELDGTTAEMTPTNPFNSTAPSSTLISLGSYSDINNSGNDMMAMCFRSIDGYSKFGSYEGNGSTNGPIVETGFEVGYIMIKNIDSADNWAIFDNKRDTTNPREKILQANLTAEESTEAGAKVNFLANGFQLAGTGGGAGSGQTNTSGETYIYLAFATDPDTEQPTLADSFGIKAYSGTGSNQSITGYGFAPNFLWLKQSSGTEQHYAYDTIRGYSKYLHPNLTSAEGTDTSSRLASFDADGFSLFTDPAVNGSGSDYIAWCWKANDDVPTIFGGPAYAVYKFEDNVDDVTGNYDGTANSITYATGKFNKAAVFNGSTGDIDLAGDIESSTMAVSLWAYLDDNAPTNQIIIEFDNGYGLNFPSAASGKVAAQWGNSNANHTLSNAALSDSQWYHIAANFRSGATDLYIDGVKQTTGGTAADYLTADQNTIGSRRSGEFFDGMIDQVRIYNGNFQQIQIDELYAETVSDNDDLTLGAPPMAIVSANANAGFSIVKYEGTGSTAKVPHGLSAVPEIILSKNLTTAAADGWPVYSQTIGNDYTLILNTSAAKSSTGGTWGSTSPTSTVFTVQDNASNNQSGNEIIAYCFHSVAGYSKIGTYTGTGATHAITGVGFQPDWIMGKEADGADSWEMVDSVRGIDKMLYANGTNAEVTNTNFTSFDTDGFTLSSASSINESGKTYIYMSFKENPTLYPLAGNMSFLTIAGGGSGGADGPGGGGAGGLITSYGSTSGGGSASESDITLAAGTYTITVGPGGASQSVAGVVGNIGGDSIISGTGITTITVKGGGGGGSYGGSADATDGGSGGGGANSAGGGSNAGGLALYSGAQGNNGGNGWNSSGFYGGGGGGGAGAVGAVGTGSVGGNGGSGLTNAITVASGTGPYYAGGGGGGGYNDVGTPGTGGTGGGGAGSSTSNGVDGSNNTGGGGGGTSIVGGTSSGAGGSGIVILRLLTSEYSGTTTGSPTVTTNGDYSILTYTGSGTYVHS